MSYSAKKAQLIHSARLAGMSEMASSVLHNVGNVLNSVNVSANLLTERMQHSELMGLIQVARLIKENKSQLARFITEDAHGKYLPDYLVSLAEQWQREQKNALAEINTIINNIQHIKNIIKTHQSLNGALETVEVVSIIDLLEDALIIANATFGKTDIAIHREYDVMLPAIKIDKVKLLQIFVNLIRNAIEASLAEPMRHHHVTVRIKMQVGQIIQVQICDNGIGMDAKHLAKLFSYGFTTKKSGHGFGLHASMLYAKEMGGKLTAHSEGLGFGTTFTLELPLTKQAAKQRSP